MCHGYEVNYYRIVSLHIYLEHLQILLVQYYRDRTCYLMSWIEVKPKVPEMEHKSCVIPKKLVLKKSAKQK